MPVVTFSDATAVAVSTLEWVSLVHASYIFGHHVLAAI
jgi:hypothetical protein